MTNYFSFLTNIVHIITVVLITTLQPCFTLLIILLIKTEHMLSISLSLSLLHEHISNNQNIHICHARLEVLFLNILNNQTWMVLLLGLQKSWSNQNVTITTLLTTTHHYKNNWQQEKHTSMRCTCSILFTLPFLFILCFQTWNTIIVVFYYQQWTMTVIPTIHFEFCMKMKYHRSYPYNWNEFPNNLPLLLFGHIISYSVLIKLIWYHFNHVINIFKMK